MWQCGIRQIKSSLLCATNLSQHRIHTYMTPAVAIGKNVAVTISGADTSMNMQQYSANKFSFIVKCLV